MPPRNRRTRGTQNNIRIPIHSLSGGVGRQAPSKRTPLEAQDIDNALVTLERSIEKRPGTELLTSYDSSSVLVDGGTLDIPAGDDMVYEWFFVSDDLRYLLAVDYSATDSADQLLYIYKYTDNDVTDVSPSLSVSSATREYITYNPGGSNKGSDVLRFTQVGPKILILNSLVKAGYSSTYNDSLSRWELMGLDGVGTGAEDIKGKEVDYLTASVVDPEGTAIIYTSNRTYVSGTEVYDATGVYKATEAIDAADAGPGSAKWVVVRSVQKISVQDHRYPDASKRYLGQSLFDFQELKLPPKALDITASNNAELTLNALYGQNAGQGKVYFIENAYASTLPGYYRIVSTSSKPYFEKVRTPDAFSRFDENRMPHLLSFNATAESWELGTVDWNMRESGDKDGNPGPQVFANGNQVEIKAMSFFRDRLWLAAEDSVFSSRAGEIEDFFLHDPSVIGDEDPIDVRLSTNKYTPVSYMTPFENYLFINTPSDVQFILQGSENLITPLTAEVSPTSFYSTASMIEPILMGSQVYFFAPERMYLYLPEHVQQSMTNTIEVSQHCPDYLPSNFGEYCVVAANDTIMVVDADNPTDLYVYTNRFSGNQVSQSSFFRYRFADEIETLTSTKDTIYMITKDSADQRSMAKMKFYETNSVLPLLDNRTSIDASGGGVVYDSANNQTQITIPNYSNPSVDSLMFNVAEENGKNELTGVLVDIESTSQAAGDTVFTVSGNLLPLITMANTASGDYSPSTLYLTAGISYKMMVELSPLFSRDQQNNVVDGVLSLRTMHTRHFNTGNYRIEVAPDGQSFRKSSEFNAAVVSGSNFADAPIDERGESVAKLFGFSDATRIQLISDYPTPVNITNMEIKGRFRNTFSSFIR